MRDSFFKLQFCVQNLECVDKLDKIFIGKDLDQNTVNSFPEDIDLCGENGEYHTFSYAGGLFKKEIDFSISQINKISYDINLDNGQTKTFEYWQADIISKVYKAE